ncbi:phosphotransferase [Phytoactinopolyspora alkaliphila]|uniref:Phosphotransferase n=1 Tax=Phytoactinopolyspora alkaliphila TaxID=1783498 RepID=A0A6N9YUH9_9ACTN|nr:fructosamine kinase family protein [Phytoactinopolyspora alkaliphila]NED98459.1 phosphotransferase [Phytoactinopolyspora alkaliphila]
MTTTTPAEALTDMLGEKVDDVSPVGGGDICHAFMVRTTSGRTSFVKRLAGAADGFFASEAEGLRRLAEVHDGVPVPHVLAVDREHLALEWIASGAPSVPAAERFGRALATTHRHGCDAFGALSARGWIGTLELPVGPWPSWNRMWAEGRLAPYLRSARDSGSISKRDAADVERVIDSIDTVAGPPESASLVHGDLWAGNVLWAEDGQNRLVDPAAQGGHRESDLAMLALFGFPYLDRVLASYLETWPLADGWKDRQPLHQLHPVLVHAVLFGGSYGHQAGQLARLVVGRLRS